MTPRMLRIKAAADYLGVSVSFFRKNIRQHLKERSWLGVTSFDRLEIDEYIDRMNLAEDRKKPDTGGGNMRIIQKGLRQCPQKTSPGYTNGAESGTSTNNIAASAFAKAFTQATERKPKQY